MQLPDAIPGYREAIEAEARAREGAFLRLPEFVCGVRVEPLTLRRFALLSHIELKLADNWETLELFLWLMSPQYGSRAPFARARHSARCLWAFLRHGAGVVNICANAWLNGQFADAPGARDETGFNVDSTCWVSRQVDLFAAEYGWPVERVLDLPVKVAFQLEREIRRRTSNTPPTFFNQSDKLRTAWLENQKAERQTAEQN